MGIISDTFEDNAERKGQFLESVESYILASGSAQSAPPTVRCPFCLRPFFANDDLFAHAQDVHGPQHVYLRVNGAIVRDIGWAEMGINECQLSLIGFDSASVQISARDYQRTLTIDAGGNLLEHLPPKFDGEIHLVVEPDGVPPRQFQLYCGSLPEFRRADLDRIICDLNHSIDRSTQMPEMSTWLSQLRALSGANELESRYVNGFYEYALGSSLERYGQVADAKQHLEDCFGLLMPFRTELAQTVIRLLGLKMNSFAVLAGCSPASPFAPADAFFNDRSEPIGGVFSPSASAEAGIYIDSYSKLFLDALVCYYDPSDQQLAAILGALHRDPLALEKNNQDKLHLLKARWYKGRSETKDASGEYQCLQYDPIFGEEAREFLRCLQKTSEE